MYLHNPKNNNNNKIRLEVWHVGVWRNWFKPFSLSLEHKVSKNRGRFSVYTEFTGKPEEEEEAAEDMVATIFFAFAGNKSKMYGIQVMYNKITIYLWIIWGD